MGGSAFYYEKISAVGSKGGSLNDRPTFFNHLCRKQGIQGSHTDFLICAVAVNYDMEIFTYDKDFWMFYSVSLIEVDNKSKILRNELLQNIKSIFGISLCIGFCLPEIVHLIIGVLYPGEEYAIKVLTDEVLC